jgi:hypothetical protein
VSSDQPVKNIDQKLEDNIRYRQWMTANNNSEKKHATLQQPARLFCSKVKHPALSQFHSRTVGFRTDHVNY